MKKQGSPTFRRKRDLAFSYLSQPGSAPGTITVHPDLVQQGSKIFVIAYNDTELVELEIGDPEEILEYLGKFPVTWVNVDGLGDVNLLEKIAQIFKLHSLAMEDVVNLHQRPKIDEYDEIMFSVARMPTIVNNELLLEQISIFWSKNFVITFQSDRPGDCLNPLRERIKHGGKRKRLLSAEYLAYAMLDTIIDSFFPILEYLGIKLDTIEESAISNPNTYIIVSIHEFKHDLQLIRRAMWSQRDAIRSLSVAGKFHGEDMRFFIRDCEDHTIQLLDIVESYRERTGSLIDIYLSGVSNKMNQIMKVLTIMATIFMPLSWICSVYGMNFDYELSPWNMPELQWYYGYPFAWGLMIAIAGGLLFFFWKKGWLKK